MNEELSALLRQAAAAGAKDALRELGLDDSNAMRDIQEMRNLLDAYRIAKKAMIQAAVKVVTVGVIGAILAYAGFKIYNP